MRMTRRFARAPRGERARGTVPCGRWRRLTLVGALGLGGLAAVMTIAAPTTTAVFRAFVKQVLAPALRDRPGAFVVMDNLAPHEAAALAGLGSLAFTRLVPPSTLAETTVSGRMARRAQESWSGALVGLPQPSLETAPSLTA